jgi:hypothetical protein
MQAAVEIAATAQQTWDVVTDWSRQGEWIPLTTVDVVDEAPTGAGTRLLARTGIGVVGFDDPMLVEVWRPPVRCEVVHLGRLVTGRGVFLVESLPGDRSRFTWREEFADRGARRYVDRLARLPGEALLRMAARRLARAVIDGRPG